MLVVVKIVISQNLNFCPSHKMVPLLGPGQQDIIFFSSNILTKWISLALNKRLHWFFTFEDDPPEELSSLLHVGKIIFIGACC
jgi:hypothetical protein